MNNNILENVKYSYVIKNIAIIVSTLIVIGGLIFLIIFLYLFLFKVSSHIGTSFIITYLILYMALIPILSKFLNLFRFKCGNHAHYTYVGKNTINPHINIGVFFNPQTGALLNFVRSLEQVTGRNGEPIDILIYSALCDEKTMERLGFQQRASKWTVRYIRKSAYWTYCWAGYFWTLIRSPNCQTAQSAKITRRNRVSLCSRFDRTWIKFGTGPEKVPNATEKTI